MAPSERPNLNNFPTRPDPTSPSLSRSRPRKKLFFPETALLLLRGSHLLLLRIIRIPFQFCGLGLGLGFVDIIAKLDRYRGDRYGTNHDTYRQFRGPSSRFSDPPLTQNHSRRSSNSFRGGPKRGFDSPPGLSPAGAGAGGGGGGFDSNHQGPPPLSGQKRGFPFYGRGGSPDRFDRGSFAKLFIGSVPRTATEEDIRPMFEEHGNVIEVALLKDKRTGQQQGCCFIKYATSEEADRAIRALHNQRTLPGGVGPIQVRYADGERERLGAVEYKLFVGSLNKQATEKEVEQIFSQYGQVEDVYLMRDELKQSRGCGFVKYSHKEMALAAINALNGCYTMRGCDQPLTVRFADPKKPRSGDSRGGLALGGLGFGPRFQESGPRPMPYFGDPAMGQIPPNSWHPMSPPLSSNSSVHGFGGHLHPRSGNMTLPGYLGGTAGGHGGPADSFIRPVSSSLTSQQSFNQSMPQVAPVGPQISPLHKPVQSPQHLPSSLQLRPQTPASYLHTQTPQLPHSAGQTSLSQPIPSQQLLGLSGQLHISHAQVQTPSKVNLQLSPAMPRPLNTNQLPPAPVQQQLQPLKQSPSQLAQMISQQTQALQASYQSSKQAFSELQQQLQLMQPSNQGPTLQQSSQTTNQQQWPGSVPPDIATHRATPAEVPSSSSASPAVPLKTQAVAPVKCNWTEHTSPDGYKYYYNSVTGESRWEKPEELILYERQQQQQQQKASVMPPHSQSLPLHPSSQQGSQTQQVPHQTRQSLPLHPSSQQGSQTQQVPHQTRFQTQLQNQHQLQQPSLSSTYQASGIIGQKNVLSYMQLTGTTSSVTDPPHFQQGHLAAQEWMWKNKPTGT